MKNKKLLIGVLLVVILIVICICCSVGSFILGPGFKFSDNGGDGGIFSPTSSLPDDVPSDSIEKIKYHVQPFEYVDNKRYNRNPSQYNKTEIDTSLKSISSIEPLDLPLNYIQTPSLVLFDSTLEALAKTNWGKDGNLQDNLPIDYKDLSLSSGELSEIADKYNQARALSTPDEEVRVIFEGNQSEEDIKDVMMASYDEFIKYIKIKDANDAYLKQIDQFVMPREDERFVYDSSDYTSLTSASKPLFTEETKKYGFSARYIELSAGSIYNFMKGFMRSGLLGEINDSNKEEKLVAYRDIAIRFVMYHEMTHVVQQSYDYYHTPSEDRTAKFLVDKTNKSLMDIDEKNNWNWSNATAYNETRNLQNWNRVTEGQAEGVAFEILTNVYDMSDKQRDVLWTHLFGVKEPTLEIINQIKDKLESNRWDEVTFKEEIGDYASNGFFAGHPDAQLLTNMLSSSTDLPIYIGYTTPLRPEDAEKFWDQLSKL